MRRWSHCALALVFATSAQSQVIDARYAAPTTRYDHGVLGDAVEWGELVLTLENGQRVRIVLPQSRVFEDVAPRLVDVDLDGAAEVITVESDTERGARLAIYGPDGLKAATPFIGERHRWLAPVGAVDLDGDGAIEIAYVDRPHLARILRVWRFADGVMTEVASLQGVTNHRIGEADIAGGIRNCGDGPELIVADADWRRVMAIRFDGRDLRARAVGRHEGRQSIADALACR